MAESDKPKNEAELSERIAELCSYDVKELPRCESFVWVSRRTPQEVLLRLQAAETGIGPAVDAKRALDDLEPTLFHVGSACPLDPTMVVYCIFQGDDVVRVYAYQTAEQAAKSRPRPPTRFTLGRTSLTYGVERMSLDTFMFEIASELDDLGDATDWLDEKDADEPVQDAAAENAPDAAADGAADGSKRSTDSEQTSPPAAS